MTTKTLRYNSLQDLDRQLSSADQATIERNNDTILEARAFAQEKLDNDPKFSDAFAFLTLF